MPRCIITKCPHKRGGKPANPGVILHAFPNSIERIKLWLLQTGQAFQYLDELAEIILKARGSDLFRMCSRHFDEDSYVDTGKQKKLMPTAIPTMFPEPAEGRTLIEEFNILKKNSRNTQAFSNETFCLLCGMAPSNNKIMIDQSTQTESDIWGPTVPQVERIYLLTHSAPNEEIAKSQETTCPNLGVELPFECKEGPSNEDSVRTLLIDPVSAFIEFSIPQEHLQVAEQANQGNILTFTVDGGSNLEKTGDQKQGEVYKPSQHAYGLEMSVQQSTQDSTPTAVGDPIADMVKESKYIVFDQCLDNLLHKVKCQDPSGCSKVVQKYNKEFHGSAVIIRGSCEGGHHFRIWESQPKMNRYYAGNVLLAASLLTTGQDFQNIETFLKCFGIRHISKKKFHQYQRSFVFPSIHDSWKAEQDRVQNDLRDTPLAICGRGQYTSSDHTKFCVYTMMDIISDKIFDLEVVQRTQCNSSMEMESHGLNICMSRAMSSGQDIVLFASYKKINVQKLLRTKYKNISQHYDVQHYAKRLKRKLIFASRGYMGVCIKPWISKILKHFWWSVHTSKGNGALLKEKWLSLLKHIQNIHTWNDGELYHKCAHAALSEEACAGILWLKEGTVAYKKVAEIICNPKIMKDLGHLVWNFHIGERDVFHINGHSKQNHFSIDAIEARAKLAVIRHNHNLDCMPATNATTPLGSKMTRAKRRKTQLLNGTYTHLTPILQDSLRIAKGTKTSTWVPKGRLTPQITVKTENSDNLDVSGTTFS